MTSNQIRTYDRTRSVVFLKTDEPFGGLSNMAGGFSLHVQGIHILTAEALYQACRFPHMATIQKLIIEQKSPMTAKMKSKPYRKDSRPDWNHVRVNTMRWCLRVKLAQNWTKFSELLLSTEDRQIVEESRRDGFWGAKPVDEQTLIGLNVLGRLLMELRESVKLLGRDGFRIIEPPNIDEFLLFGRSIRTLREDDRLESRKQALLFNSSSARETSTWRYTIKPPSDSVTLDPYSKMKESGVEWLGKMPEHWEVRRMKTVAHLIMGQSPMSEDCSHEPVGIPFLQGCAEFGPHHPQPVQYCRAPSKVSPTNAILISVRAPVGRLNVADQEYGIGRGLCAIVPYEDSLSADFARYEFEVIGHGLAMASTGSTYDAVSIGDIGVQLTVLPPLSEQTAIVRYLDYVDRQVQRLTRAKRKLVTLLTEQKQAVIHCAVTRGLDPDVPMKDSGVGWLREVPEHWEVMRLKHWVRINKKTLPETTDPSYEFDYIEIGSVTTGRLTTNPERIQFANAPSRARRVVQTGDTIVSTVRTYLKAVWHAEEPVENLIASTGFAILTPNSETSPKFVSSVAQSDVFTNRVTAESVGIAYPAIAETKLSTFEVAIPPLSEQIAIVEYLDRATADIDAAIARANREIELLDEYRTRLIADVVTGKLDVREAAAALPEVDPLEMEEESP